ncbi:MAG: hypothetical protein ACRET1_06715 [Burkholderiales bacterium]
MKLLLALVLLVTTTATASAADDLGRLFFTPAQRAQLDVLRERHQRLGAAAEARKSPLPQSITVNGVVTSSDGKSTVWINHQPVTGGEPAEGVDLVHSGSGHVTLRLPDSRQEVNVKVGESLNPQTGDVTEGYEWSGSLVPPEATDSATGTNTPHETAGPATQGSSTSPGRGQGANDAGGITK